MHDMIVLNDEAFHVMMCGWCCTSWYFHNIYGEGEMCIFGKEFIVFKGFYDEMFCKYMNASHSCCILGSLFI